MTNGNFVFFRHQEVVTWSKVVLRISYYIQLEVTNSKQSMCWQCKSIFITKSKLPRSLPSLNSSKLPCQKQHLTKAILGSLCLGTIFSRTHVFWHHLNFHHIIPRIKWLLLIFLRRLWAKLIPFVRALYAFKFPLIYNHCNHENDVIIIPFTMGTHQGDPFGGALFNLAHGLNVLQLVIPPLIYFHQLQTTFTS
jgi:hypothetical protein